MISSLSYSRHFEKDADMEGIRLMIEADMSRKRRKEIVDKLAASYILQGYLDNIKNTDI